MTLKHHWRRIKSVGIGYEVLPPTPEKIENEASFLRADCIDGMDSRQSTQPLLFDNTQSRKLRKNQPWASQSDQRQSASTVANSVIQLER